MAARRAQSTQFCTPSQLVVAARADAMPSLRASGTACGRVVSQAVEVSRTPMSIM
jgi:hypothetical protein